MAALQSEVEDGGERELPDGKDAAHEEGLIGAGGREHDGCDPGDEVKAGDGEDSAWQKPAGGEDAQGKEDHPKAGQEGDLLGAIDADGGGKEGSGDDAGHE